ncbi:MAG: 2Fe-2S iron-sulfur cluster-binding protein [Pseudomonadota bacterium]
MSTDVKDKPKTNRSRFTPLTITDIRPETRDAVVLTLEPPADRADDFKFIQGQYLTFRREFEGEELRRSYSICSGIHDNQLRVGIKKVDGGWFSTWANDELKVGDTLDAMAPMGKFYAPLDPDAERLYYCFAGGSGITPMVSIIRTVMQAEPKSRVVLVYANRSINSIMFKEELNDIKDQYLERFTLLNVLEMDSGDIDMFNGRVDAETCDQLFTSWLDPREADYAFICGPEPMMLGIAAGLERHGMEKDKIKFELFKSVPPKKARTKTNVEKGGKKVRATIIVDGQRRLMDMPASGASILEAAMENKIDVPYSCRAGVCSTCSAKVIKGDVDMEVNYGLEDYEVERGFVLTCQSFPKSDEIVIDYDQH